MRRLWEAYDAIDPNGWKSIAVGAALILHVTVAFASFLRNNRGRVDVSGSVKSYAIEVAIGIPAIVFGVYRLSVYGR